MSATAGSADRTRPDRYSFGGTAAIVTSMGLIVGFDAATISRATLITSLLIIALADNISDSLSIHMYQESERLEARAAFRATVSNFLARLLVALSFILLVALLPSRWAVPTALVWGSLLLSALTFSVARVRETRPGPEIVKHLAVAIGVIAMSRLVATAIRAWMVP